MNTLDLKEKNIVIAGIGVNNQHLAKFLKEKGINFLLIDKWNSLDELTDKFKRADIIFRTPGLPYNTKPIQEALQSGANVYSQTKFFFDLCPCPIIGVTGTKGKGTTSSLIASILRQEGKRKIWLAGNIGQDPFEFIDQVKADDLVVLELSSFQLQDLHKSPHIAVVLNISRDHIDESKLKIRAIHYSFDEYLTSKSQILVHQTKNDFAILGPDLPHHFQSLGLGRKILADRSNVKSYKIKLLGEHNRDNIAAARAVALVLHVPEDLIKKAVSEFKGLEYRLQDLGEIDSVRFINDGLSTSPAATNAAIKSFVTPIILILGGFDKGVDFSDVGELIKNSSHVKGVVVIGDETEKILKSIKEFKGKIRKGAKNMKEIVSEALGLSEEGDTILFSPGTSSFDMFDNEFDRSAKFSQEVAKL